MAEYIERETCLEKVCEAYNMQFGDGAPCEPSECFMREKLMAIPTAEVEPVRHGRWIVQKCECISTTFECSECGRTVDAANDYFAKPTEHIAKQYPYCHCGAKMDGGADNG